jgi:hypothetical protein
MAAAGGSSVDVATERTLEQIEAELKKASIVYHELQNRFFSEVLFKRGNVSISMNRAKGTSREQQAKEDYNKVESTEKYLKAEIEEVGQIIKSLQAEKERILKQIQYNKNLPKLMRKIETAPARREETRRARAEFDPNTVNWNRYEGLSRTPSRRRELKNFIQQSGVNRPFLNGWFKGKQQGTRKPSINGNTVLYALNTRLRIKDIARMRKENKKQYLNLLSTLDPELYRTIRRGFKTIEQNAGPMNLETAIEEARAAVRGETLPSQENRIFLTTERKKREAGGPSS